MLLTENDSGADIRTSGLSSALTPAIVSVARTLSEETGRSLEQVNDGTEISYDSQCLSSGAFEATTFFAKAKFGGRLMFLCKTTVNCMALVRRQLTHEAIMDPAHFKAN